MEALKHRSKEFWSYEIYRKEECKFFELKDGLYSYINPFLPLPFLLGNGGGTDSVTHQRSHEK